MSQYPMPMNPPAECSRSCGPWARFLTILAVVLAIALGTLAICMSFPVRWDGIGKFGALALHFPLHVLVVTAGVAILAIIAKVSGARTATALFTATMFVTAAMALIPTFVLWRQAQEWNVPLSLNNYIDNARRFNSGVPMPDRTMVYGTAKDGTKLELDVWKTGQPNTGPLRPAIVFVHGGGWNHGTRSGLPDWNRWLNDLGYEVFDIEYRMPPPARWLDEIGDVKSALGWVSAHAADYHVDPARISLMGGSAGANLSMLAAYSSGDSQLPASTDVPAVKVRSVINFYGPTDMSLLYYGSKSPEYVRPLMKEYIGGTPEDVDDRYRALSPLTHVTAKAPPTLTLLGTSDRLVATEQAELLNLALKKAGVPHEMYLLPYADHGFDVNWGGFPTQIARAKIKDFLQKHDAK